MENTTAEYIGFASWRDVLNHVRAGLPIWYHAPMDYRPVRVACKLAGSMPHLVRVYPPTSDADPFTADARHLERFRQQVTP